MGVLELGGKEALKISRSAFRNLIKELSNKNINNNFRGLSQKALENWKTPLPEIQDALSKPGVDPRIIARNIVATGRANGRKVSSNERRQAYSALNAVDKSFNQAQDITDLNKGLYIGNPFVEQTYQTGFMDASPSTPLLRRARWKIDDLQNKFNKGELTTQDLINLRALQNIADRAKIVKGATIYDVTPKNQNLIPPEIPFVVPPRDIVNDTVRNNLLKATGKEKFIDSFGWKERQAYTDLMNEIKNQNIQITPEMKDYIYTLAPTWEGTGPELLNTIRMLMGGM